MSGTFSSFSTALSALRYNRAAMDVASGNIANAGTDGYARRTVIGQATGAPSAPAVWSRWQGAGDGVEASRVDRMVDPLLDARSRTEHALSSYADTRAASLQRFESSLGEPGDNGIAAALAGFKSGWHDVANQPGDAPARNQLLARAQTLQQTIAAQSRSLGTEWSDQRTQLGSLVDQVNQTATDLASLNKALQAAHLAGTDAGTLLDRRDQLTLKLAEVAGGKTTVNPDSTVSVTVGGQNLVSGTTAKQMALAGASALASQASNPVELSVGGTVVPLSDGEMGAGLTLLNGDLPDYLKGLDGFVSDLVTGVNTQHAKGVDLNGNAGGVFFTGTTADTLKVAISDPDAIAAAAPGKGPLDNTTATAIGNADLGDSQYRSLVTGFGVNVASAQQLAANQHVLTSQVDSSRESLSGVSIDEEMVNLMAAQRGYEGASRVLTTVDSTLDTLINRTGLVGR